MAMGALKLLLAATSCLGAADAVGLTYDASVGQFQQAEYGNPSAPKRKTWWAKRLSNVGTDSERFYIGGQPSARDLKMLYEEGFSTVYSLWNFSSERTLGMQTLPTTAEAVEIAADAGLLYGVWTNGSNWISTEAVDHIEAVLDAGLLLDGPIFLHCYIGRTACQAMQAYRARKGIIETQEGESVTAAAMRECGAHGFRLFQKSWAEAIAREAGEDFTAIEADLPLVPDAANYPDGADQVPADADGIWWNGDDTYGLSQYHWLKYLWKVTEGTKIFDAGQIEANHVQALVDANIGVVVNMRKSIAAQEETNLLNIGKDPAQDEQRQDAAYIASDEGQQFLVDTSRDSAWVDDVNGVHNFESLNAAEFGDTGGYNEQLEKAAVLAAGLEYLHLPIGSNYTAEALALYAVDMISMINTAVAQEKSILFHCRTGYRTGTFPTALRGVIESTAPADLQAEMSLIGYDFDQDGSGKTLLDAITTLKFCETPDAEGHYKGFVTMQDMDCSAGPPTADALAGVSEESASDSGGSGGASDEAPAENATAEASAASSQRTILLATAAVLVAAAVALVEGGPDE